ncbi:NAD(P)H-hydrate repair Nnr-like enzyme with NAD(P)H-hydrate dehydratase domain [Arthrobacter sp. PvP023]|uniref:ADP-dependent NAD(P)H-hydrate dehydratase n=1 Tax=Micrococcaceae TaxID=1268 RepID=UPI001AE561EA|nr:ADP/ATP-dependent (S)-NAD(P)H-hydrate dehydratase [Arthrobacter sp. PvP023]MBP1133937.1 NAD(P)H-hydrate repair Nnr-like enzyme with NAD(P)H-hydrate dehydratase domain [Arthrobacter sp. PvP023]
MSTPHSKPAAQPVTPTLLRDWPLPGGGSGKDDRGSVLVIGGARKTPGAALLAGTAVLRAGAGRLTLAVAGSTAVQVAVALPEAGVVGLAETDDGAVEGSGVSVLAEELEKAAAVLAGPGLDDMDEAESLLRELLKLNSGPANKPAVVLDAYALGCLPGLVDELGPWSGRLILTPNTTEAGILLGREVGDLHRDVAEIAGRYGAVVSCQGVIAAPDAGQGGNKDGSPGDAPGTGDVQLWEITTGYGGLGTSGSGDILAGAIAGLRARGTSNAQATCWGTHLHAAAGDRLASRFGSLGYLARELADELPALMMELGT